MRRIRSGIPADRLEFKNVDADRFSYEPSAGNLSGPRRRRAIRITALALLAAATSFVLAVSSSAQNAGELDSTFDGDGKVILDAGSRDEARDVAIQPDGKTVVAGTNGDHVLVARLNEDGSLDSTFGTNGVVVSELEEGWDSEANAVVLQPDGKVVVAGSIGGGGFRTDVALARYNADGSHDTGFGSGGVVRTDVAQDGFDTANDIVVDGLGRIIVAGEERYGSHPDSGWNFILARYTSGGDLDLSFGTSGVVRTRFAEDKFFVSAAHALLLQPDGKLVAAGDAYVGAETGDDFGLARYHPSGALDSSFGGDGRVTTHVATKASEGAIDLALQPDGKLVAVGETSDVGNAHLGIVRYHAYGSVDTSFGSGGVVKLSDREAQAVGLQLGGKIVVARGAGGDFQVIRLNGNGGLDTGFGISGFAAADFGADDLAEALWVQPDGRIVAAGRREQFAPGEEAATFDVAVARFTSRGIAIGKVASANPATTNRDLTYSMEVVNYGPSEAREVTVADALPASVRFVRQTASQGSCSYEDATRTVTCHLGTLSRWSRAAITIVVQPTEVGLLTNTATVESGTADPDQSDNTATATTTVQTQADLAVTMTSLPAAVRVRDDVTFTITARNDGPEIATGVVVDDFLPSALTYRSATTTRGTCTYNPFVVHVRCAIGTFEAGDAAVVTLVARANRPGPLINTATVSGQVEDSNVANNRASRTIDVAGRPFDEWVATHCTDPPPQKSLKVAYIPARFPDTTAALTRQQIEARVEYIKDYFFQQSMCSVTITPYVASDPEGANGYFTLPRAFTGPNSYNPQNIPAANPAGQVPITAWVWIDALRLARERDPQFRAREADGFDAIFVIETVPRDDTEVGGTLVPGLRGRALSTRGIAANPLVELLVFDLRAGRILTAAGARGLIGILALAYPWIVEAIMPQIVSNPEIFEQGSIVIGDRGIDDNATWVHELGHGLFTLWDYYNSPGDFFNRGNIGPWGLMGTRCCVGAVPPSPMTVYERVRAGWLKYRDVCSSCFGDHSLTPLGDMRFGADVIRYETKRNFWGHPEGPVAWYLFELRKPLDGVPPTPETEGGFVNAPERGNWGVVVYSKRDINRYLGVATHHPWCSDAAHGFSQSAFDTLAGYDFGSCVDQVVNPVNAPDPPTLASASTGGSLEAGKAYRYSVTAVVNAHGNTGETIPSADATIAAAGSGTKTSTVTLTFPAAPLGWSAWRVYRREDNGPWRRLVANVTAASWTDTGALLAPGDRPTPVEKFTLQPGTSFHDDIANVTFSLNTDPNDPKLSIQGTAQSRTLIRMGSRPAAEEPDSEKVTPAAELHIYSDAGDHVGSDGSGGFELGIPEARAGGIGTSDQWISIPDDVQASFVVDASRAIERAEASGVPVGDVEATVSVFRYDANGVRGKLGEPVEFILGAEQRMTGSVGVPLGSGLGLIEDTAPPVVTPPAPIRVEMTEEGGARVNASPALAAFLAGASGVDAVDPFVSPLAPQIAGVDVGEASFFAIGTTAVTFRYEDAAGHVGSATATVTVVPTDAVAPSTTASLSPTANAAGWNTTAVTVTLSATDAGRGVEAITYRLGGQETTVMGDLATLTVFVEGTTAIAFRARDKAGNEEAEKQVVVRIDRTAPAIEIAAPVHRRYRRGTTLIADYHCTDSTSGIASCLGPVVSGTRIDTRSPGRRTFTVAAADVAGNESSKSVAYVVAGRLKKPKAKPKRVTLCHEGQTNEVTKRQVREHRKRGDELGPC